MFWLSLLGAVGLAAGLVYLAMHGWLYISVPLMLAAVSFTGRTAHRVSVLRGHLRLLDRRHAPLPQAILHAAPGSDPVDPDPRAG